jgi:hypothetical protein
MKIIMKLALRITAVIVFALVLTPVAYGQDVQSKMEEAKRAEIDARAAMNERRVSEWELRSAEVRRPPGRRRDAQLAAAQIREDYKQIQIVNNDLAKLVSGAGALDFKQVAKSVSEIRERAVRLRENLVLPEPKAPFERSAPEVGAETKQLKSSLIALDKLVIEFVDNPIFLHPTVVNVPMSIKARADLEGIIELSEEIKKSSEKLKKLAQKTQ